MTRRSLLEAAGLALAGTGFAGPLGSQGKAQVLTLPPSLPEGTRGQADLDALPGKKPLIKLTSRPPNYETPIDYFSTAVTPNDAFFVRYHLADIPQVDAKSWKLAIGDAHRHVRSRLMRSIFVIACVLAAVPALAREKPVLLKQAAGLDKVEAHCASCHSLDYIVMNSPFPNAPLWDAEVAKMINVFGAPIDAADAKIIADYLKKNYGS